MFQGRVQREPMKRSTTNEAHMNSGKDGPFEKHRKCRLGVSVEETLDKDVRSGVE